MDQPAQYEGNSEIQGGELSIQKHLCHIYRQIGDDGRSDAIALHFGLEADVNTLFVEFPDLNGFFDG